MARIETIKGQLSFANYSTKVSRWYNIESDTIYEVEPTKQSKLNIKKYIEKDNLFKQYIKESFGDFFFNYYNKCINGDYIFRFMYLCTFINYNNYIEFGKAKGENRLATKKDVKELLNLQKTAFNDTYNNFIKNKMIIEDAEGYVLVNNKFCNKGKIRRKDYIQRNGCVRMFNNAIKELYEKATAKEHKQLDLFIKLLPLLHYDLNVVCENPTEDIDNIIPLGITKLAKELGYSNYTKFKKALFDITIGDESAIMVAKINKVDMIVVNPKLYYKGANIEELKGIQKLFEIADRIRNR